MSRYLNDTDEEYYDFLTHKSAKPGDAIDVPDDWDGAYENHPVWSPVNGLGPTTPKVTVPAVSSKSIDPAVTVPAEPVAPLPINTSPAEGSTSTEQS